MERKCEGKLTINDTGRWTIWYEKSLHAHQLTSGSVCEVKIADHWIATRIECDLKGSYYAVVAGVKLYKGMPARLA